MSGLLDPSSVRRLAAEVGVKPSKQRGQNFVIDANTVRRIVAAAKVSEGDVVLEVGPGLGSLTLGLLAAGASVTAVEIESAFAAKLPQTIAERMPEAADRLRVVEHDALTITEIPGPEPTSLVANLPYNVAVPVLLHLWQMLDSLTGGLVMVQAEVADRICAQPGSKVYGVPSVKMAWYAEASWGGAIGRKVFWPEPNVESGLVQLRRWDPPSTSASRQQVFTVIDAAFAQRRKMLRSALSGLWGSSAAASEACERAGVDPTARGETLDVAAYAALAAELPDPLEKTEGGAG